MRIEHIALWTKDLERSRKFYSSFFGAKSGEKYENSAKGFTSYFMTFESGCRLEIMNMNSRSDSESGVEERFIGISHLAISVGTKRIVDELTECLRKNGFTIVSDPRESGDGYYESVVLDPDNNRVEITV